MNDFCTLDFLGSWEMIGIREKWSYKFSDLSVLTPDCTELPFSWQIDAR
jgi:hypothetical protein